MRGLGLLLKHCTTGPGIASTVPAHNTKILSKCDMYYVRVLPRNKAQDHVSRLS